ncbi:Gfo/Idh/MocA family oxidoreductase [Flagellimonas sp. HSM57]|uniref:Gfo/Idh/MocA family protein n=1 Tax=unclassified Flagellimonas TaxID=2644544 RepID=UPI00293C1078|nr:Gfo/Idh/MocA family oxidoreductase [Flagellimonas sp. HSM57]
MKLKWGIIGPGNIAKKFVADLLLFDDVEIGAVASRALDKAQGFAEEYGIGNAYGSYEELFKASTSNIVYIATPHNYHKELAIKAMEYGKHVLCEKPLGVSKLEVEEIIAVAKKNKVFLMEGLWSRFNPSIKKIKTLIDTGTIGELAYLHADFAFYGLNRDEKSRILNPDLASGSLLDIGIYPIFLAYLLLGKPDNIHAFSNFHTNGTELQTSMIFQYPAAQAVLYSGLTSRSKMEAEISGSKGSIYIHPRWHEANGFSLEKDGSTDDCILPMEGNGFVHEIREVHHCLKTGKLESELWTHQNSLDLSELLDNVRAITGIKFPFEA